MDKIQKQSILILINSIESQLNSLKALIGVGSSVESFHPAAKQPESSHYTSDDEDAEIEEALRLDERDQLLQNVFKQQVIEEDSSEHGSFVE